MRYRIAYTEREGWTGEAETRTFVTISRRLAEAIRDALDALDAVPAGMRTRDERNARIALEAGLADARHLWDRGEWRSEREDAGERRREREESAP